MKIGIISDTHIKNNTELLEYFIKSQLKDMDMLIHAGDFITEDSLNILSKLKKNYGVFGNNDDSPILKTLKEKEILLIEDYRIGVCHGHGLKGKTIDIAYETFKDHNVDIIIFGHSHQPIIQTKNRILMINPGSPFIKRKEKWHSYAILELDKNNISVEMKFYSHKIDTNS